MQFFTTNTTAFGTDSFRVFQETNAIVSGNLSVLGTCSFTGQVTIQTVIGLTPSASNSLVAASKGYVDSQVGANNELSEVLANRNTTGGTVQVQLMM